MSNETNIELFKLITRRWIAWPISFLFSATATFLVVWGAITSSTECITAGIGIVGVSLGAIIGFYFGKKMSEE